MRIEIAPPVMTATNMSIPTTKTDSNGASQSNLAMEAESESDSEDEL